MKDDLGDFDDDGDVEFFDTIEQEKGVSIISLSGKRLMNDLVAEVNSELKGKNKNINIEYFSKKLTARFVKSINNATTGFGAEYSLLAKGQVFLEDIKKNNKDNYKELEIYTELDFLLKTIEDNYKLIREVNSLAANEKDDTKKEVFYNAIKSHEEKLKTAELELITKFPPLKTDLNATSLTKKDNDELEKQILAATTKLAEELKKENEKYYFYKSENSLTQANKERYFFNIAGKIYDSISSTCHKIAVTIGLKDKTAAELFAEVAKRAEEIHENLSEAQIKRNNKNYNKARAFGYEDLRKKMERNNEKVEKNVIEKNSENMEKTLKMQNEILSEKFKNQKELVTAMTSNSSQEVINQAIDKDVEKAIQKRVQLLDLAHNSYEKIKEIEPNSLKNTKEIQDAINVAKQLGDGIKANFKISGISEKDQKNIEELKKNLESYLQNNKLTQQENIIFNNIKQKRRSH